MPQTPSESWTDGPSAVPECEWSCPMARSAPVTGVRLRPGTDAHAMTTAGAARLPGADRPGRGASVVVAADLFPESAGGRDRRRATGTTGSRDLSPDQRARGDGDARERPGAAEPLRSGGSRAAPAGVPRRSEERPGGRVSPLGLRLRHRDTSGRRRLPVGGRVRGEGARLVPYRASVEVRLGERQRPQNPGEIRHCPARRGENARKEDGAEEETNQYHRFLPDEEENGGHAAQIRTITRARNASVSRLDSCPHWRNTDA